MSEAKESVPKVVYDVTWDQRNFWKERAEQLVLRCKDLEEALSDLATAADIGGAVNRAWKALGKGSQSNPGGK